MMPSCHTLLLGSYWLWVLAPSMQMHHKLKSPQLQPTVHRFSPWHILCLLNPLHGGDSTCSSRSPRTRTTPAPLQICTPLPKTRALRAFCISIHFNFHHWTKQITARCFRSQLDSPAGCPRVIQICCRKSAAVQHTLYCLSFPRD